MCKIASALQPVVGVVYRDYKLKFVLRWGPKPQGGHFREPQLYAGKTEVHSQPSILKK